MVFFTGSVSRLAPSSPHHGGTVPILVRRFSVDSSTRPGERGAVAEEEEQEEEEKGGRGRVLVNVSSCGFPQSQLVLSLTSTFDYSRAVA